MLWIPVWLPILDDVLTDENVKAKTEQAESWTWKVTGRFACCPIEHSPMPYK